MPKPPHKASDTDSAEIDRLVERWILAFCEAPPLLDADLMRAVLAQYDQPRPPAE